MTFIDEIEKRFQERCPGIPYRRSENSIWYVPPDDSGFTATLNAHSGGGFTVAFNGWHEEFTEASEARDCFGSGLSPKYRLVEQRRGGTAYHWALERQVGDEWEPVSEVGLLFFPFWRKREEVHLQNHLLATAAPD